MFVLKVLDVTPCVLVPFSVPPFIALSVDDDDLIPGLAEVAKADQAPGENTEIV